MMTNSRIPTLHIVADSIPLAYFKAVKAVWEQGLTIRTEYDRKDKDDNFIDPPSRDARVLIEVTDPFCEPRFPPVSFCEIGVYIAEILGLKDHYVVPLNELKRGKAMSAHEWPYTYHQRLFNYPMDNVDQIELAINRIVETPHSRRAVATTAIPNIDPFLKEDVPCLREIQFRCPEDEEGNLVLNMNTMWRSRDLYKAWADNVIGLTFLQSKFAAAIAEKAGRPCKVGSYADYSSSLHIYGQDFSAISGDKERGIKSFFDNFTEAKILDRAMTSKDACELLVLPQLKEMLTDRKVEEWKLDSEAKKLLKDLITDFETGRFMP
jgi:thymidylate synthase